MSRWREVVREELARYRAQTEVAVVDRQDLLEQALPRLEAEFPDSNTHGQSLSKTLRQLRQRDEIANLSPGTYRILSLDYDGVPDAESPTNEAGATADAGLPPDAVPTDTGLPPDSVPADTGLPPDAVPTYTATEYETTATGRRVHTEFRAAVLERYGNRCPVSGVDHAGLLDVAHVLPWSDFPAHRADFGNVLALDKTHHAAFDRGLFTLDREYRLRVDPAFETDSELLARTLADRDGEEVALPEDVRPSAAFIERHNERLDWSPA